MKIIIECECGNIVEVSPETLGNVAYFAKACRENNITIDPKYEVSFYDETISDPEDVDVDIKELELRCGRCGQFISLDLK